MLSERVLLDRDGVEIVDVSCRYGRGRGRHTEQADRHAVVFVRGGCFVRSADGVQRLLDSTQVFYVNPGQEQRFDHPHGHGDDCTVVRLQPDLLASLWGEDPTLPTDPGASSPGIDLEHRLLAAAGRQGADPHELVERTISLVTTMLAQADPGQVASGRPATVRARRALVDGARERLAADPDRPLAELAAALGSSAHHLSRIFRAGTGHTIARHRMRLRVRAALERLSAGEHDLARLAADLGFADQSHMCRVVRSETGRAPSTLRRGLR